MEQHADVVPRLADHLADVGSRQVLDLTQMEDLALQRRQAVQALADRGARLSGFDELMGGPRRSNPSPVCIEARLERVLERLHRSVARNSAASLLDLVPKDPKQPGTDRRPSLETIEGREEGQEHVLHDVLGVLRRQTHATSGPIEPSGVRVDDRPERRRVTATQPIDQLRVIGRHHPIIGAATGWDVRQALSAGLPATLSMR